MRILKKPRYVLICERPPAGSQLRLAAERRRGCRGLSLLSVECVDSWISCILHQVALNFIFSERHRPELARVPACQHRVTAYTYTNIHSIL